MNDSKHFFKTLLDKTKQNFAESNVKILQEERGENWNYAICDTPIVKGKGIIFGINWGGNGNFVPHIEEPDGLNISDYIFIKRSKAFLEKGWDLDFNNINFNYSNLCFFRSPKASDLIFEDFDTSLPLFKEYVKYIKPPWLLSIGGTNIKILDQLGCLLNIKTFEDDENKFKGYTADLWGYKVYSVPHPSARLKRKSRQTIWNKITNEMKRK
jgi:hypothetical protein